MGHQNEETHNPPLSNWWIVSHWREGKHLSAGLVGGNVLTGINILLKVRGCSWTTGQLLLDIIKESKSTGLSPSSKRSQRHFSHFFNLQEPLKLLQKRCFHASGTTKKYNDTEHHRTTWYFHNFFRPRPNAPFFFAKDSVDKFAAFNREAGWRSQGAADWDALEGLVFHSLDKHYKTTHKHYAYTII